MTQKNTPYIYIYTHTNTHTHTLTHTHTYIHTYTRTVTEVAQWLRCRATDRKVAVSIPAGVIGIFH